MELSQLYVRFHKSLLEYVKGKIRSSEDAEDILHNVFAKIAGERDQLPRKENMKNWIFIITRNAVYDYYRRNGQKQGVMVGYESEEIADALAEDEHQYSTKGLDQGLEGFIDLLPDRYQQIVRDSELKGIPQKELAERLNMPYSSLRSRVQRGRDQLRQLLTDCCNIELDRRGNIVDVVPRKSRVKGPLDSCKI